MSWNVLSYHSFFDIHPAGVDVFDEPLAHRCPIGSDPLDNGLDLRNLRPPRLVTDFVDLTAPSVPVITVRRRETKSPNWYFERRLLFTPGVRRGR